jgi:rare lipoprotein A
MGRFGQRKGLNRSACDDIRRTNGAVSPKRSIPENGLSAQGQHVGKRLRVFDLALASQDNSRWSVCMNTVQNNWRGSMTSKIKNGLAAGLLVVALSVAASGSSAPDMSSNQMHEGKTHHWLQIGKASWYGLPFQGRKTANGEKFDMNSLTCAHRQLPMGSWVRVTNLKNRKSIFVRVNDRGPLPEDRIVDLSYAAARAVGLAGLGKVKLEVLKRDDPEMAQALMAQLKAPPPFAGGF